MRDHDESCAAQRARITADEVDRRFGLNMRSHRIGELDLHFVDIEQPDALVRELYSDELEGVGDAPTWPVAWPAAYGLAEYLLTRHSPNMLPVLELGCGTAVPGVAAACAGGNVLATDHDWLALTLARRNAELNGLAIARGKARSLHNNRIRFRMLDWFDEEPIGSFGLILGADIVYYEPTYEALLQTAERHLDADGHFLLSDPGREQMRDFLPLARERGWLVETSKIPVHLWDASHTVCIRTLTRS